MATRTVGGMCPLTRTSPPHAGAGPGDAGPIRVLSVPSGHPYVHHLAPAGGDQSVVRLPDPLPHGATVGSGRWWPPRALQPRWVRSHLEDIDVLHVHFGIEHASPDQLREVAQALAAAGKPLVFTVHDLVDPHGTGQEEHDERLEALVSRADEVITLTAGAAEAVRRRWAREPVVIAHPQLTPDAWFERADGRRAARRAVDPERTTVGVHLKSLRANVQGFRWLPELADAVAELPGGTLRIDLHDDVHGLAGSEDPRGRLVERVVRLARERSSVELHVHERFDDEELAAYLCDLDISVLPYAFGTHSGWLESCYDLGTAVLAPDVGFYADQHPGHPGVAVFDPAEPGQIAPALAALARYRAEGAPTRLAARHATRDRVVAQHQKVYARALAGKTSRATPPREALPG